jgi:hypothetical protein
MFAWRVCGVWPGVRRATSKAEQAAQAELGKLLEQTAAGRQSKTDASAHVRT